MEWVEITGRTLAEAKEAALDHLGVAEEDAEFEILAEPRSGIFGIGRAEARVRARVRPTRPRPKGERRSRRRGPGHGAGGERRPRDRVQGGRGGTDEETSTPASPQKVAADGGPAGADRGRRRTSKGSEARRKREARPDSGSVTAEKGAQVEDGMTLAEQGEMAKDFLTGVLERLEMEASVEIDELDEETLELRVVGSDLGLLIGPKGVTLGSLQELTRTVVQRRSGGRTGRLLVDVGGYRQKRRAALERFAHQVAEEVRESGVEEVLEPMSPPDRKVIHDTINSLPGVGTRSQGEEPRRSVVVVPSGD